MTDALDAFASVDFHWVRSLESVWADPVSDVPDLNSAVVDGIVAEFFRSTVRPDAKPFAQVVVGPAGIGKTHMVGRLRKGVWERGGWFVLLDIVGLKDFWRSAALSFANSLAQRRGDGRAQGEAVLSGVASALGVAPHVQAALRFPPAQSLTIIEMLTGGLDRFDRARRLQHQEVFRALYLFCCQDADASNLAYSWLQGMEVEPDKARALGFASSQRAPVDLVRGLSWIMSLAGPTLVAVDQIDSLVATSRSASVDEGAEERPLIDILAAGLTDLHDVRQRGMTVLSCIGESWDEIQRYAPRAARDRFAPAKRLLAMPDAGSVGRLILDRLGPAYAEVGFSPPYPTWPFTPAAIESGVQLRPRPILMRCEAHRLHCVEQGRVLECSTLLPDETAAAAAGRAPPETASHDEAFAQARAQADLAGIVNAADDARMGALLRDALGLYVRQIAPSDAVDVENRSDPAQQKPPLHGRLTFTFHDENDRERHFCFRAIEHGNAIAFQSRLGAAMTASGIDRALADRHLFLLRRSPVPGGAKTAQLVARFAAAGGVMIAPGDEDLRILLALRSLHDAAAEEGRTDAFDAWLRARQPLAQTSLFREAGLSPPPLARAGIGAGAVPAPPERPAAPERDAAAAPAAESSLVAGPSLDGPRRPDPAGDDAARAIPLGHRVVSGETVTLSAALLPRHTAIIAGVGSGKTVLLRRLVEEAALLGIPSIVLDPNNDLSRLGDGWPARPPAFTDEDEDKARRYGDTVEVVIWTPGARGGRPLTLPVLPDFASLGADADEREQAVGMAMDTLASLVGLTGARGPLKGGVLSDALRVFAARGGGSLDRFIALLADLPEGASGIDDADRFAAEMANLLRAAVSTNPLLKGDAPPLDPAILFGASEEGRTRVSVVNLSGLGSDSARHDFVNRLQMTLFGWIKAHPSPSGRLYVIDEAQEFVPSQASPPSRGSAARLVAQARKYGLGMIVATQMPKGIDHRVVSNCSTHFFGKQSAPAAIDAVREIVAAKNGRADDLGRLLTGEFYFSTEGSGRPAKVRTPLCLTDHPQNPLTPEEVLARARSVL